MRGSKLRILYVVPATPSFAGIERVTDSICEALASRYETQLHICVLFMTAFPQIVDAQRSYEKIISVPNGRLDMLRRVRKTVSRGFDLVIVPQVEATALFWVYCFGIDRNFIMHLHGNPRREISSWRARVLFQLMRLVVLPRLKRIFGTSPRQLEAFHADYPSAIKHVWVPNPVRRFDRPPFAPRDGGHPLRFVSVGRFAYQKGYDLLLHAFAAFRNRRTDARLSLVGYGEEEPVLRELIQQLDLKQDVSIEFHPDSPAIPLSQGDVYLSGARWEGWSLAICEALRFGLPVVAFDCEFGPSDILVDDRLGRLVAPGDIEQFVEAMVYYYDNIVEERRHAGFRADYIDQFSLDRVVHVHAHALMEAAGIDDLPRREPSAVCPDIPVTADR